MRVWSRRIGRSSLSVFVPVPAFALVLTVMLLPVASGCAHRQEAPVTAAELAPPKPGTVEKGEASWYGHPYHGRRTASGERYDMHQLTAAHRTLPFDTRVVVT